MSEITPLPYQVRVRWGLQTGHTTSQEESWGRLLSLTLTFLLPVLLPNIEPVARGLRAGDGSQLVLGLGPQRAQPRRGGMGSSQGLSQGPWRTRPTASGLSPPRAGPSHLTEPPPTHLPSLCAHGL